MNNRETFNKKNKIILYSLENFKKMIINEKENIDINLLNLFSVKFKKYLLENKKNILYIKRDYFFKNEWGISNHNNLFNYSKIYQCNIHLLNSIPNLDSYTDLEKESFFNIMCNYCEKMILFKKYDVIEGFYLAQQNKRTFELDKKLSYKKKCFLIGFNLKSQFTQTDMQNKLEIEKTCLKSMWDEDFFVNFLCSKNAKNINIGGLDLNHWIMKKFLIMRNEIIHTLDCKSYNYLLNNTFWLYFVIWLYLYLQFKLVLEWDCIKWFKNPKISNQTKKVLSP